MGWAAAAAPLRASSFRGSGDPEDSEKHAHVAALGKSVFDSASLKWRWPRRMRSGPWSSLPTPFMVQRLAVMGRWSNDAAQLVGGEVQALRWPRARRFDQLLVAGPERLTSRRGQSRGMGGLGAHTGPTLPWR